LLDDQLNGKPALFFTGELTGDSLESPDEALFAADFSLGFTFAGVARRDAAGDRDTIFDMIISEGEGVGKNIYLSQAGKADNMWFGATTFDGNSVVGTGLLYTQDAPHVITIVVGPDQLRFRFDGVDALPLDPPPEPPTLPSTQRLFAVLGMNVAQEVWHHGLIAELIMYERAFDDAELSALEQHLQQEWGQ
jgi:hypothetical protein